MKTLKLFLVLVVILISSINTQAQDVIKFKTTSCSFKETGDSDWSDWKTLSVLVVVETSRITIYAKDTKVFDIIKTTFDGEDSDGDYVSEYVAIDEKGAKCELIVLRIKDAEDLTFCVKYSNVTIAYSIYQL